MNRELKGANKMRTIILAHVRRLIRNGGATLDGPALVAWIKDCHTRYNKRKGGLGK